MTLRNIEFVGLPDGEVEVRQDGHEVFTLTPEHIDFTNHFIDLMIQKKPLAYEKLCERYRNSKENHTYHDFLVTRGFIKCNFIIHDNRLDIDENGNFHTEFVICPRMGECKECGFICNSPDNTELSNREIDVLRLIKDGFDNGTISEQLYISINTVHTHRTNILRKIGGSNTADMVRYWYEVIELR